MTQTGQTERIRIAKIQRRRQMAAASISARITTAFDSYRWLPFPTQTQAEAWARLLDFAGHLLGMSAEPMSQAATAMALQQWLNRLRLSVDGAVAMLLKPGTEPDGLLEMVMKAAIESAIAQFEESMMQQIYQMLSAVERMDQVQHLREAFPAINEHLGGLPSWVFIEELPAIHGMCAEELKRSMVQHDTDEARYDFGGLPPPDSE